MLKKWMPIYCLLFAIFPLTVYSSSFVNIESIQRERGFLPYYQQTCSGEKLKVAVFDKGFLNYKREIGKTLPQETFHHSGPVSAPTAETVEHGTIMAKLLVDLMSNRMEVSSLIPELHLYNVYGYSNLKFAVEDAVKREMDVILYSEVWEYGGNFDGKGFINALVTKAIDAGILWVNAAGNFAQSTYQGKIQTGADQWLKLPCPNQSVEIRCNASEGEKCPLRLVLSWNDFKDNIEEGTDLDLDVFVTDDTLNMIQSSSLEQTRNTEVQPGQSKYPREIIATDLDPGLYYIRIKNRGSDFKERHQLRIAVSGEKVKMPQHCTSGPTGRRNRTESETLLNPADHPGVITVGASDSERSSSSQSLGKPELTVPSSIILEDESEYRGSSNSAAIVAAMVGALKCMNPEMQREGVLRQLTPHALVPAGDLGFTSTRPGCFQPVVLPWIPPYFYPLIQEGGVFVMTSSGVKMKFIQSPFLYVPYLRRLYIDDMLVLGPAGYRVAPRIYQWNLSAGTAELFQSAAPLCVEGESHTTDARLPAIRN